MAFRFLQDLGAELSVEETAWWTTLTYELPGLIIEVNFDWRDRLAEVLVRYGEDCASRDLYECGSRCVREHLRSLLLRRGLIDRAADEAVRRLYGGGLGLDSMRGVLAKEAELLSSNMTALLNSESERERPRSGCSRAGSPIDGSDRPSRAEVLGCFEGLREGRLSRDEVACWARAALERLDDSDAANESPGDNDDSLWDALYSLTMSDAETAPGEWLYSEMDFVEWRKEYESSTGGFRAPEG